MIKERNYNFKILIDKFVVTFHKINQNKLYILKDYSVWNWKNSQFLSLPWLN
jgi:hypothetical protein